MTSWQQQMRENDIMIQMLTEKSKSTLTKEKLVTEMVERYFLMEMGTKKGQKLQRANDFLREAPLVTEKDIDEKMKVEGM